jgi:hypothetical protein
MQLTKNRFVALWLCAAVIVTVARVLNAADLGYDLTAQIEAAQNLLQGHGLSIYSLGGEEDLAQPARLLPLAHFPCGYSFCAAALIAMGFSVAAMLKTWGALATILGWWGWGKLAFSFFSDGLKRGWVWRWAAFIIAISTPLLFTPVWKGTDIFLWAAVPWVISWVVKASDENVSRGRWLDGLAGAVCGLCVLMRYASVFLAAYIGVLILCHAKTHLKILFQRWALFAAGLLPPLALQVYINQHGAPGGLIFKRELRTALERLWDGVWLLTSANYTVVWWLPQKLMEWLTQPGRQAPWLLGITLAAFAILLPLFAKTLGHRELTSAARDVRIAATGLFVTLPLFLCVCMMFGDWVFVADLRYYVPLVPLAVFVAYAFATVNPDDGKMRKLIKVGSLGYIAGYLCIVLARITLFILPIGPGSGDYTKLMGTTEFQHWPSMKIEYEFSPARKYLLDVLQADPTARLLTSFERWFYAEPTIDRSRLTRLSLRAAYVTGPARILIATEDTGGDPLERIDCNTPYKKRQRPDYLTRLPGLHLLRRFPDEKIKVLEANVPPGTRVTLPVVDSTPGNQ